MRSLGLPREPWDSNILVACASRWCVSRGIPIENTLCLDVLICHASEIRMVHVIMLFSRASVHTVEVLMCDVVGPNTSIIGVGDPSTAIDKRR